MGAVVVDTSVVIGYFDPADAHYEAVEPALLDVRERGEEFILPASVLAESMVGRLRREPSTAQLRRVATIEMFGEVRVIDEAVAMHAAQVRASHPRLRLPDALVIATGIVEGATVLTCDAQWAAVDERVRVVG